MKALCTYSSYLSTSDLLSFVISKIDKHEFRSILIGCSHDVMNHVDYVKNVTFTRRKCIHVLKQETL